MVAPLRFGGGTRLKILEAMALGTPVVSTAKGAEGLVFREPDAVEIADDPAAFARAVVDLLEYVERRARQGQRARAAVRDYDWARLQTRYLHLIDEVTDGRRRMAATA